MHRNEKVEQTDKIWRVPKQEPLKKFSILDAPVLTHQNKEEWYAERRKEQIEKRKAENKIF